MNHSAAIPSANIAHPQAVDRMATSRLRPRHTALRLWLGLGLALASPTALLAQTGAWATDTAAPGLGGRVDSFLTWQGSVYAGGTRFGAAESGWINSLARWDGTRWQAVGTGVQLVFGQSFGHIAVISSMCEYGGELIVAGTFDRAGGQPINHIARWDGASFRPLGQGLVETGNDAEVRSLTVFQNQLYAAGTFDTAGGQPAQGIARWNGTSWAPCGSGLMQVTPGAGGDGRSLLVQGTELWVGGEFGFASGVPANNIARWNGSTFQPVGNGLNGLVMSLAEYAGQVCAGGIFDFSGTTPTGPKALWNGSSWQSIGPVAGGENPIALCSHGGSLYAAGGWLSPNGFYVPLQRWNGVQWTEVGGVAGELVGLITAYVQALVSFGSELWVGGNFTRVGNPPLDGTVVASTGVAVFDGANWTQRGIGLGIDGIVTKVIPFRDGWVAIGNFASAGAVGAKHCAFFDGDGWQRLGTFDYDLADAAVYQGDLIVMGNFTTVNGLPIRGLARLHGTTWTQFGPPGFSPLLAVRGGVLYAGANSQLQTWNGTSFATVASVSGSISDLHVHTDGNLYFTTETWNQHLVYRWNGTTATLIGTADNFMRCLGSYGNDLILGGTFTAVSGVQANLLARWNGSTWSSFGLAASGYSVECTAELDGQLYIGTSAAATNFVQRWTGTQWQPLGSGLNSVPQALFADRATSSVRAFGNFFQAGGRPVWNYAEWRNQPRWQNRLHGLAGVAGIPLLRGSGTLTASSQFRVDLEGPANHVAVLGLGFTRVDQALLGGTLVPSPDATLLLLGSPTGASSLQFPWPAGMPAGLAVFTQGWLIDASGPQGWTATNALQATSL